MRIAPMAAVAMFTTVLIPFSRIMASTDSNQTSAYSLPIYSDDGNAQSRPLLPVAGTDLPIVSSVDSAVDPRGTHEPSPIVEAIPTPTAFQTGLLALICLGLWRIIRKIRMA